MSGVRRGTAAVKYQSLRTGRFVSQHYAKRHPKMVKEVVPVKPSLNITHWEGGNPFCEDCSHYHAAEDACLCAECGTPMPCRSHGS